VRDPDQAVTYHLTGMWANFALSAGLITWFVARMSGALRERDAQLALARQQHAQSERISALGMLAANAAHEMGTPLSTIAVIAGDLRHEAKHNAMLHTYSEDLATIEGQIALCKASIERMGLRGSVEPEAPAAPLALCKWLENFIEQWRLRYPATRLELVLPPGNACIRDAHTIGQILLILLDNAAQASAHADTPIRLSLTVQESSAVIEIKDEGQGIATDLLKRLGYEPVRSTSGGQGIGLMLAFASARQFGAGIELASQPGKGTMATLTMPLA